jgi:serine/threonine protein kinase
VAVKLICFEGAQEPGLKERFAREAKVLASLDHPNIVKILSWGETLIISHNRVAVYRGEAQKLNLELCVRFFVH